MPKLKTKSGAKKGFKMTPSGKVKAGVAGKRHRLISHNAKYIRQNRGTDCLSDAGVVVFHPHELDAVRPALRLVGGEFDEAIKTGDVRPAVYAKLKALDVFAGAEDV